MTDGKCWWCNGWLAKTHALAKTPEGDVRVHKVCVPLVDSHFRRVAARIDTTGND